MADKTDVYLVLRRSGAPMQFTSGFGLAAHTPPERFTDLLHSISRELGGAGSNYDEPHRLLKNGVEILVDLGKLSWAYTQEKQELQTLVSVYLANHHTPKEFSQQRAGSNPPGIDKWSIVKNR